MHVPDRVHPSASSSDGTSVISSYQSNHSSSSDISISANATERKQSPHSIKTAKELQVPAPWTQHKKHFFILSSAGKPVWTRYGDETRISSLMGVVQAIISFFQDGDDMIKSIHAGHFTFVFVIKGPLYFVAVSRTGESSDLLREQLLYLHNQILSVLTSVQLTRIFEQRVNFDLRRLLAGTEVFLDSLSSLFSNDHSFMLNGLQCLRLNRSTRGLVGAILSNGKSKSLLYAMVVTKGHLVTLLRPRKHSLHPSDLQLLFNMLTGSTTFHTAESWTPLCLPKYNSKGFLHAYICYIARDVAVVMISTDKDSFFEMSEWKTAIVEALQENQILDQIQSAADQLYKAEDVGAPGLLHFLYKSKAHVQFTSPNYTGRYSNDTDKIRLFRLYQHAYDRMHRRSRPLKLYYHESDREIILGWITSSFELYSVFQAGTAKPALISSSNQLIRWIKKNEENLFILDSPVF